MECVKEELPRDATAEPCHLCLSTERALSLMDSERWAYRVVTEQTDGEAELNGRVCWECKAELRRMLRFKRQALRARQLLERARSQPANTGSIVMKSLSRLSCETKTYYDMDISYNRDTWKTPSSEEAKEDIESFDDLAADFEFYALPGLEDDYKNNVTPQPDIAQNEEAFTEMKNISLSQNPAAKMRKQSSMLKLGVKRGKPLKLSKICDKIIGEMEQMAMAWDNYRKSMKLAKHPYKCIDCVKKFKHAVEESKHVADCHSVEAGEYACEICTRRFGSQDLVMAHRSSHEQLFKCKLCSYLTVAAVKMKVHYRKHVGKRKPDVSVVEPNVLERSDISKLVSRNESDSGFDCEICGLHVKTWLYFKIHHKTHTNPRPYQCDLCGTVYKMRNQLLRHIKMHEKRFLCEICGKSCAEYPHLKLHLLSHSGLDERPHACTLCPRKFITKDKLLIHLTMHEGVKPFKCDVCGQKFRVKGDLRRHEREKHQIGEAVKRRTFKRTKSLFRNKPLCLDEKSGEPKFSSKRNKEGKRTRGVRLDFYECNVCGRKFSQKVGLDAHVVVHTGERPFKCNECDLTFKFQSGLWSHKQIHKGLKQHQCPICGAQFTLKGNLTGHLKIHSNDKPYECEICGQKFPWRRNLRNHYKIHNK